MKQAAIRVMRQIAIHFNTTFHYTDKRAENNVYTYKSRQNFNLSTDHSGVSCIEMRCSQPDAWCHQMWNRQGYGKVTIILSASIIAISVRYMKNKICFISKRCI